MHAVAVSWKRATKVWWSFTWRFFVGSILVGLLFGTLGFIVALAVFGIGEADATMAAFLDGPIGTLASWLIPIPIALWAMRATLTNDYSDFNITLVQYDRSERDTKSESTVTEPDHAQEPPRAAAA